MDDTYRHILTAVLITLAILVSLMAGIMYTHIPISDKACLLQPTKVIILGSKVCPATRKIYHVASDYYGRYKTCFIEVSRWHNAKKEDIELFNTLYDTIYSLNQRKYYPLVLI